MNYTLVINIKTTDLISITTKRDYHNYKNSEYYDNRKITIFDYIIYDVNKDIVIERTNIINNGIDINKAFDLFINDIENKNITIVAHNVCFDTNIILSEAHRYKRNDIINIIINSRKICTCVLAMSFYKLNYRIKLSVLNKKLFEEKKVIQEQCILSDVKICAKCYFELINVQHHY